MLWDLKPATSGEGCGCLHWQHELKEKHAAGLVLAADLCVDRNDGRDRLRD
jgi:hypothetical protein